MAWWASPPWPLFLKHAIFCQSRFHMAGCYSPAILPCLKSCPHPDHWFVSVECYLIMLLRTITIISGFVQRIKLFLQQLKMVQNNDQINLVLGNRPSCGRSAEYRHVRSLEGPLSPPAPAQPSFWFIA